MKNRLIYSCLVFFPLVSFGTSLQDVYNSTLQNDESIKTSYYDFESKKKDVDIAKARYLPNFTSTIAKTNRTYTTNTAIESEEKEDYYSYELSVSQPIIDYSIYSSIKEAQVSNKFGDLLFKDDKQKIVLDAINIFIDGLISKSLINSTEKEFKYYEVRRLQFEEMYRLNLIAKSQLDKSKLEYNEILIKLNSYKNNFKLQALKLSHYMNEDITPLEDVINFEQFETNYDFDKLVSENYQLQASKVAIDLTKQRLETAKSGHYPVLDLVANYTKYESDNFINDYTNERSIGIQLKIPLYQGGSVRDKIEKNKLIYQSSKFDLLDKTEKLKNEYEELTLSKEIQIDKIKTYELAIKDTEIYYNSVLLSYEKNLKNRVDLSEAEYQLIKKRHEINEAKYEKLRIDLRLKFLIGKLESLQ